MRVLGLCVAVVVGMLAGEAVAQTSHPARYGFARFTAESSLDADRRLEIDFEIDRGSARNAPIYSATVRTGAGERKVTSAGCPDIHNLMAWMAQLPSVSLDVPGIFTSPDVAGSLGQRPTRVYADGVWYALSASGTQADGAKAAVTMQANAGPLAQWGDQVVASVAACVPDLVQTPL